MHTVAPLIDFNAVHSNVIISKTQGYEGVYAHSEDRWLKSETSVSVRCGLARLGTQIESLSIPLSVPELSHS